MRYAMKLFAVLSVLSLVVAGPVQAGDWLQFRGAGGNPVADAQIPEKWADAIAWKSSLPGRGLSSPIVIGKRIVVTCSDGFKQDRLFVLCFDSDSGKKIWQRQFRATGRTYTHPTSAVAAPTPASDGKSIFAFFSSNDLICLDLNGNLRWFRGLSFDYPKSGNDVGMASSPVVADGVVTVQIEAQGDSFATGIDTETGETRWRISRLQQSNWASPVVFPGKGSRKSVVLLQSPNALTGHDIGSGKEIWRYEQAFESTPSIAVVGSSLFLPTKGGTTRLDFTDDSNAYEVKWEDNKLRLGSSSPVVRDNRLFILTGTVLKCADADTGKVVWQTRVSGKRFWATPVIAGDRMFCANQDGDVEVIRIDGKKGSVVAQNSLGEALFGTPAIGDGAIFIRSNGHLWKIAGK